MVQTGSFGPKPCPNCGGKGYVSEESASKSTNSYRLMGILEILFYSVLAGVIGYHIWLPLGFFGPILIFVYLHEEYGR
jgi:hypothetical protein